MSSLVLFDVSLSLARVLPELNASHMNVLEEGVRFLITLFQQFQPLEQVSLMSFHSEAQLLCPFTSNYNDLFSALYVIEIKKYN